MKYCSKCGNKVDDEAIICPKCGCLVNDSFSKVKGLNFSRNQVYRSDASLNFIYRLLFIVLILLIASSIVGGLVLLINGIRFDESIMIFCAFLCFIIGPFICFVFYQVCMAVLWLAYDLKIIRTSTSGTEPSDELLAFPSLNKVYSNKSNNNSFVSRAEATGKLANIKESDKGNESTNKLKENKSSSSNIKSTTTSPHTKKRKLVLTKFKILSGDVVLPKDTLCYLEEEMENEYKVSTVTPEGEEVLFTADKENFQFVG